MASQNDAQRVRQIGRNISRGKIRDTDGRSAKDAKFTGAKPSAFLYLGVALVALLKDLLDLVGIGSLPGIGTVVTLCFTFLIWMLLTLFDRSSQGAKSNMMLTRGLVVIGIGLIEALGFGLNFLPIETTMVILLYHLANKAYQKAIQEAARHSAPDAYESTWAINKKYRV